MIRLEDVIPMDCPCGGGRPFELHGQTLNAFWVECPDCGNEVHGDTEDEARAAWNVEARAILARGAAA